MNLRRKKPNDSLYMLLDTMCNAFGGIILLAVLVVLLTSKERSQNGTSSDTQEMLQRRLAIAMTNLEQSVQLNAVLHAKTNDNRWKDQITLLSARKDLQNQLKQIRETIVLDAKKLDTANAADPSERLKFLNSELAVAQAQKLDAQNSLAAVRDNAKRLKQRASDMQRQIAFKLNDLQRPLRLPKEHETGKRIIYVIARYGHIYPCRNSDLSRNESDIVWTSKLDREIAEPIPRKGLDPIAYPQAVEAYFNTQSKGTVYMAFCVFQDSFPAFIRARQLAIASGITYGWEPFRDEDGPVVFSENGHRPKAQ